MNEPIHCDFQTYETFICLLTELTFFMETYIYIYNSTNYTKTNSKVGKGQPT